MSDDSAPTSPAGPDNDITEWLAEYVRANLAEHHSLLYDETPRGAIQVIVKLVLCGLVINASSDDPGTFEDPTADDTES